MLPSLWDGEDGLDLALDRRALERDRAALRLERGRAWFWLWC
jgi:hypothetical protein